MLRRMAATSTSDSATTRAAACWRSAASSASASTISPSCARRAGSSVARSPYSVRSAPTKGATASNCTCACRLASSSARCHSACRLPGARTKFSTGITGRAHQVRISSSARCLGSTGSRVSTTYMAASACSSSARSTLASCSKASRASGPCRKARTRAGRVSACSVFRYSSSATESSRPGVSMKRTAVAPARRRSMASAWRVVPGRSDTSPKSTLRVSVRSSEVLPALVWPTTAMRSGSVAG